MSLFQSLPEDVIATVQDRMLERRVSAGDAVIEEGQPGNALFVVISGELVVEKARRDGRTVKVGRLGPGDFFGEFALLTDRKRRATVRAVTDAVVGEIARKVMGRVAKEHKDVARALRRFYRQRLLDLLLVSVPLLDALSQEDRKLVLTKLRFRRFHPGDVIIEEGSEGGGFYLILVGQVSVTKRTAEGDVELAVLGDGEYFGEMSLLKSQPAMATVRAVVPTEAVELASEQFYRIVGEYPKLWDEMMKEVRRRELLNHALLSGGPGGPKEPVII